MALRGRRLLEDRKWAGTAFLGGQATYRFNQASRTPDYVAAVRRTEEARSCAWHGEHAQERALTRAYWRHMHRRMHTSARAEWMCAYLHTGSGGGGGGGGDRSGVERND
jgi:hypothetical protein